MTVIADYHMILTIYVLILLSFIQVFVIRQTRFTMLESCPYYGDLLINTIWGKRCYLEKDKL
jgi:hypothetical protein